MFMQFYLVESHTDEEKYQYSTDDGQHNNPKSYTAFWDLPQESSVHIHVVWSVDKERVIHVFKIKADPVTQHSYTN
jgi:hypothetical protein